MWTLIPRKGRISHLEQPSDLTSKVPLWLWGWLWDGSSSFQSLGHDPRRCPCRETTVPKHILKIQLSRNEKAAEEESGSSEGGKWDHTLKKPLKNSSPATCKTWMLLCCKDLFAMVHVRPWRNSRVAVVPIPPHTARFMLFYHSASYPFLKLALQAPKSSLSPWKCCWVREIQLQATCWRRGVLVPQKTLLIVQWFGALQLEKT